MSWPARCSLYSDPTSPGPPMDDDVVVDSRVGERVEHRMRSCVLSEGAQSNAVGRLSAGAGAAADEGGSAVRVSDFGVSLTAAECSPRYHIWCHSLIE